MLTVLSQKVLILSKDSHNFQNKVNEEDASVQSTDISGIVSKYEISDICTDESSPVLASDSGPIIREAKCVRKVTNMAEEREKFFNQREEVPTISMSLENPSITVGVQRSPLSLPRTLIDSSRSSITTDQQQPPPYHIAAAYSKQAAYFQRTGSPASVIYPQKPLSPVAPTKDLFVCADKSVFPEEISDHEGRWMVREVSRQVSASFSPFHLVFIMSLKCYFLYNHISLIFNS